MSHPSEERIATGESTAGGARIIPFERPQSDLQKAIQLRAQAAIDRDLDLETERRKPRPVKWIAIFALACIPVLVILGMVDGFLRVMHKVGEIYGKPPPPADTQSQQQEPLLSDQPGVIILQPMPNDTAAGDRAGSSDGNGETPSAAQPPLDRR